MLPIILTDIKSPITYLPAAFAIAVALTLLSLFFTYLRTHTIKLTRRHLVVFLLIAYVYTVIQLAFFSRPPGSRSTVSLIPGETWGTSIQSHAYVIENILMTIPLGIFLRTLWPGRRAARSLAGCLSVSLACSIAMETAQLLIQRGHCQIDDVLTNVAGALVGWTIAHIGLKIASAVGRLSGGHKES